MSVCTYRYKSNSIQLIATAEIAYRCSCGLCRVGVGDYWRLHTISSLPSKLSGCLCTENQTSCADSMLQQTCCRLGSDGCRGRKHIWLISQPIPTTPLQHARRQSLAHDCNKTWLHVQAIQPSKCIMDKRQELCMLAVYRVFRCSSVEAACKLTPSQVGNIHVSVIKSTRLGFNSYM